MSQRKDALSIDEVVKLFMGYGMAANRSLINSAAAPEFAVPEATWLGLTKSHEENVAEPNRMLDELGFTKGSMG